MAKVPQNRERRDDMLPPNRELELISRIGQNLNSILNIDQVLTVLLNEVRNLLNISGASIWLIEEESEDIVCRQAAGVHIEKVIDHRLKKKSGISGWVAASGQSVIVADTRDDSRHDSSVAEKMDIEFRSILSVPLQATGDIIGAIQVVDVAPNRFKTTHQTLLEALAGTATVAIRNARLFRDLNSRTAALLKTNAQLKREITQRKKAEAELNRYKQQLEKRVKRQTIELDRSWKALASQDKALPEEQRFGDIIGKSGAMRRIYSLIRNLADVSATVLITGESGTGKEMVASALHNRNRHKDRPFVKVNCSALSDNVLESELFGHVKGAFTGAYKNKIGWFQKAANGTILLDEIGDISPGCQKRLLRVLQEREFERMGDTTTLPMRAR
ncbi:MAG: sigma 54-interacting transcriptional regulator, partial [Deltaproteobacteria bacterium]|nr:sigma 54-interacting transcriptional regulator [Deltaproteobacteria bacterium]